MTWLYYLVVRIDNQNEHQHTNKTLCVSLCSNRPRDREQPGNSNFYFVLLTPACNDLTSAPNAGLPRCRPGQARTLNLFQRQTAQNGSYKPSDARRRSTQPGTSRRSGEIITPGAETIPTHKAHWGTSRLRLIDVASLSPCSSPYDRGGGGRQPAGALVQH